MKVKPAQILSGIAALAYILCNFLNVVPWILGQYGVPNWSIVTWPIFFVINVAAFSIFTFFFHVKSLRSISAGIYLLTQLISSITTITSLLILRDDLPIFFFARMFVRLPFWDGRLLEFIAEVFGSLSSILFVIAIILSFLNRSQIETPIPKYSGKKVQGAYGDIEVLGDLLKKGLLTQEEFDLKKREILGLDK